VATPPSAPFVTKKRKRPEAALLKSAACAGARTMAALLRLGHRRATIDGGESRGLRWVSAWVNHFIAGGAYFSEGEERWSTSLGLIFKQLRT
jgi:hypothetical protein